MGAGHIDGRGQFAVACISLADNRNYGRMEAPRIGRLERKLMRNWRKLACAALCASIVLTPALADARAGSTARSSGGSSYSSQGSRGARTYDYNGAQPMQRSLTPQPGPTSPGLSPSYGGASFAQRHPFLTGMAGGFLGSWLGSLLFPHWGMGYGWGFSSVIGSVLSWLLIIWLVSMLFRIFRRRTVPDLEPMSHDGPQPAPPRYGAGGASAMPGRGSGNSLAINATDYQAFEAILKNVQAAWSRSDLQQLRHHVTPEMLSYFGEQLAENESQGLANHVEQVELSRGDLREAWDEGRLQYATAYLRWRALDYTVRTDRHPGDPDYLTDGDPQHPTEAAELWTFARSPGGHWLLSAIQQV